MLLTLPQPYDDLGHVADVGVRVHGATAEEALARLALALAALLTGDGALAGVREEELRVAGGPGLAGTAVSLLRELLYRFATGRVIPAAIEVLRADESAAEARVRWGSYDPEAHAEGMDVKAVTWHRARLERGDGGWVGQVVLDI